MALSGHVSHIRTHPHPPTHLHRSGEVDEDELLNFLTNLFSPSHADGKLGESELRQVKLMIAGLDEDGSGAVDVTEFLNVMEPIVTQMEEEETSLLGHT